MNTMISSRPTTEEMTPARIESAPSDGPTTRSSQVGQRRRQRAGAQRQRQVVGDLRGEAAADPPLVGDAPFERGAEITRLSRTIAR